MLQELLVLMSIQIFALGIVFIFSGVVKKMTQKKNIKYEMSRIRLVMAVMITIIVICQVILEIVCNELSKKTLPLDITAIPICIMICVREHKYNK